VSQTYSAIALCALGLERVLFAELERIGLKPESRSTGRVYFKTDAAGLFRANLLLRTAERILLEVARFQAPDFDALFEGAREPAWELFFAPEDRLVIERVRCKDSKLAAQTSVQSVVHKAIYEKLGAVHGLSRLPETGLERSLRVYLEDDVCTIGLDLSGDALHRRGYRQSSGEAPLKETLAAGVLLLAGWNRRLPLYDPFCGSGTLLIEAGLFGLDIAPGLKRKFAFETMPMAELQVFEAEREAARARIRTDVELVLVGSDTNAEVLAAAEANAALAGLGGIIKFSVGKAEDAAPFAPEGVLIANPPYGERLGTEEEALDLYRRLAPFAARFKGWGLGFVTNRSDFGKYFGRRAVSEHKIINGAEDQWFHWYPIGFENRPERPPREPERPAGPERPARPREERAPGKGRPERDERPHRPWVGPDKPGWKPRESRRDEERRPAYGGARDSRDDGRKPYEGRREGYAEHRSGAAGAPERRPWTGPDKPGWKPREPRRDDERKPYGAPRRDDEHKPYGAPRHDDEHRPYGGPRRDDEHRPYSAPRRDDGHKPYGAPHRDDGHKPYGAPHRDDEHRPYSAPRRDDERRPYGGQRRDEGRRSETRPETRPERPADSGGTAPSNQGPAKPILRRKDESSRSNRVQKPRWNERPAPEELGKGKKPSVFGGARGPGRKRDPDEPSE
jgi:putative N6-adenine-specific DNA methylase